MSDVQVGGGRGVVLDVEAEQGWEVKTEEVALGKVSAAMGVVRLDWAVGARTNGMCGTSPLQHR